VTSPHKVAFPARCAVNISYEKHLCSQVFPAGIAMEGFFEGMVELFDADLKRKGFDGVALPAGSYELHKINGVRLDINKSLDESLKAFSERRLTDPFPYLILDARYERIREGGIITNQAVLVAVAVDWEGRRQILAVELANRESRSSWRDFLLGLRKRGLCGVEFVVSDDHAGLKAAIREVLPEAVWQRCYVHFLRNALDYVPRKVDDDCLRELRWFYDRRELAEVRRDIAAWLAKWQAKYPKLCAWVEENIEETLSYYRLPLPHHKHMKSTNMLERLNQEIKRRTHVVRIFPNEESCLRLVRALAVEMHENWLEAMRYLNMDHLREHKKQMLRQAA